MTDPLRFVGDRDLAHPDWPHIAFLYAHGNLDLRLGFDLVRSPDTALLANILAGAPAREVVALVLVEGTWVPAVLCAWSVAERMLGLLVAADDPEGLADARAKMTARVPNV